MPAPASDHTTLSLQSAPVPGAVSPRIMVIRHAEKPGKDGAPFGVDITGTPNDDSLSPLGWQRAGALTVFFSRSGGALQSADISVPQYLFACGKEKERQRLRPLQTITLLAERLGTTVDTTFLKGEESELADSAMRRPGVVLISWEHKNLPQIANRILGDDTTAPQSWPEERFDLVWVFDLSGGRYHFKQVPQLLLPGDRDLPI